MLTATLVALTVLLALQVDTQLTVNDDDVGSCESSTSDEVVNLIREEWKDVRLMREDLKDVKTSCAPCAAASQLQQRGGFETSTLCE